MKKLMYSPFDQKNNEFHRMNAWHATFNAFVKGALAGDHGFVAGFDDDMKSLRKSARKFANSVHGSIAVKEKTVKFARVEPKANRYDDTDPYDFRY